MHRIYSPRYRIYLQRMQYRRKRGRFLLGNGARLNILASSSLLDGMSYTLSGTFPLNKEKK